MQYQANVNHAPIRTVGLNTIIYINTSDSNNVRFLVVEVISYNNKRLIADCGNYKDAETYAYNNIK